jgi:hypothetical protein
MLVLVGMNAPHRRGAGADDANMVPALLHCNMK